MKASAYQDGHASNSDPLDEQTFVVETINALQSLPEWQSTAVIITYDDSDGWYDHRMPPIVSPSRTSADALTGPGSCGAPTDDAYHGRYGFGPRLPYLLISPWAKINLVIRFIEDNWNLGRIGDRSFDATAGSLLNMFDFRKSRTLAEKLFLDPSTGQPR